MTVTVHGLAELASRFRALSADVVNDAEAEIEESLQKLMEDSQELCPVKTGALRDSAYFNVTRQGDRVSGEVGYSADYALEVHEDTTREHATGTAKFLETPFVAGQDEVVKAIGERVKESVTP